MAKASCDFCGHDLVFVTMIRKRDGTIIRPRPGKRFLVFCGNKSCKRK